MGMKYSLRGWDMWRGGHKGVCRAIGVHKGDYYVCPPMSPRDPTPKKVLYAKSAPMSDRSWQGVKTFFRGWIPKIKASNPEESFIREVSTYV